MVDTTLNCKILNKKEELRTLLTQYDQFLTQHCHNPAIVNKIVMCLDELVTNVISYAYTDKTDHSIEVNSVIANNAVVITIKDDGIAFDPSRATNPNTMSPLEKRQLGGLGLHIVMSIVDKMEYERDGQFNVLKITKSLI